jgi:hypothetical protein
MNGRQAGRRASGRVKAAVLPEARLATWSRLHESILPRIEDVWKGRGWLSQHVCTMEAGSSGGGKGGGEVRRGANASHKAEAAAMSLVLTSVSGSLERRKPPNAPKL